MLRMPLPSHSEDVLGDFVHLKCIRNLHVWLGIFLLEKGPELSISFPLFERLDPRNCCSCSSWSSEAGAYSVLWDPSTQPRLSIRKMLRESLLSV